MLFYWRRQGMHCGLEDGLRKSPDQMINITARLIIMFSMSALLCKQTVEPRVTYPHRRSLAQLATLGVSSTYMAINRHITHRGRWKVYVGLCLPTNRPAKFFGSELRSAAWRFLH